jgi:hypothetical protein
MQSFKALTGVGAWGISLQGSATDHGDQSSNGDGLKDPRFSVAMCRMPILTTEQSALGKCVLSNIRRASRPGK